MIAARRWLWGAIIFLLCAWVLVPIYLIIVNTLSSPAEVAGYPKRFWPSFDMERPLQILFSATFFVSVGMLLDLGFLLTNLPFVRGGVSLVIRIKTRLKIKRDTTGNFAHIEFAAVERAGKYIR